MKTSVVDFSISPDVSYVELAGINYDQWILTIAVRIYGKAKVQTGQAEVIGMSHVIFENVEGFRMLDEGSMLMFPFTSLDSSTHFVHRIDNGGWLELESRAGNMHLNDSAKEFLVVAEDECVSIIAYEDPKHVRG